MISPVDFTDLRLFLISHSFHREKKLNYFFGKGIVSYLVDCIQQMSTISYMIHISEYIMLN